MEKLERELLELICRICCPPHVDLDTVRSEDPLIRPDSPMELTFWTFWKSVTIQQESGVRMDSEKTSRDVLLSVATLADYIREHQAWAVLSGDTGQPGGAPLVP